MPLEQQLSVMQTSKRTKKQSRLHEKLFAQFFNSLITKQLPYVLESKSVSAKSINYIETSSGLTYVRFYSEIGVVSFSENDIENNKLGDYKQSNDHCKSLEGFVICLDILCELITNTTL
jgi:hypothetical protein